MSKNYIVDIPLSELEGQKLALMEYEGIHRLDNGLLRFKMGGEQRDPAPFPSSIVIFWGCFK